ncbi:ATP-grasp domain-containing protein [Methanogenium organophilum]|uniref:ATP-grasp domain-containing protein n=1 Tax=Methanogenium organophilum TaxID=2199 RepID=A0A9X9T884_METOG|nr:ATP-grasp domain-containing protein [Methanogenium organophilum]WAI00897.1 ATP-grasp domain-containing protein [Methanogenium organophilum]
MIHIVPKPTDTPDDNSTGMVIRALKERDCPYELLDLDAIDPFSPDISGETIWVCGIKQDGVQFEVISALSLANRMVNDPHAIAVCASKAQTTARLMAAGVPTPDTIFTGSLTEAKRFLARHQQAVYKPLYGYDGNGIFPFTDTSELPEGPYYLQEYVKNDRDYRVFVIGGVAVGAIVRISDTFAHNIHQGGTGMAIMDLPEEMKTVAGAAARAIGIDYCGVDLLERGSSYTVLEVNGTPNWHCMEAPIPDLLAEYLIKEDLKK